MLILKQLFYKAYNSKFYSKNWLKTYKTFSAVSPLKASLSICDKMFSSRYLKQSVASELC